MATGTSEGLSGQERDAVQQRAAELRTARSRKADEKAAAEAQDLRDAIAKLPEADRVLAERVDELVLAAAPGLARKTWYGFPAWTSDGALILFFKGASKFKDRYATLGFNDAARLDDGAMWAKEFALLSIGDAEAAQITELVRRAVGL